MVVPPAGPRTGKLVQVGPIADNGFPSWYRDSRNVRLQPCLTLDDPLCPVLADEVPDYDAPISYPGNFPGEFFYQLAGASLTLTNGVQADIGMDLEGAWATEEVVEGDQMVFGRVRIRFDAPAGERYRMTHPYGIDDIVATDRGINMTEDMGRHRCVRPGDEQPDRTIPRLGPGGCPGRAGRNASVTRVWTTRSSAARTTPTSSGSSASTRPPAR